jgi:thiamine kinase-like enzyme
MEQDFLKIIADVFKCDIKSIKDVEPLKKGMTNDSFIFGIKGNKKRYIIRIPGAGTDMLINRHQEYEVYQKVIPLEICDNVVYINQDTGYKITEYWENARVCDPLENSDLAACMQKLREFHALKLDAPHKFDIFERIEFYESLWQGKPSRYADYAATKANVMGLKPYIDALPKECHLTHIDAVPDNFIFLADGEIRLIDWEYSAKQDPHVDIAMFIVYSMYDRAQAENLIELYFTDGCSPQTRQKIYAYIAMCGLLWSNWCEYKGHLGIEFGDYALKQYEFAKEYYAIFG